ncbi:MAG: hypothetical protein ACRCV3_03060 [Desulfovibrionaceae bacterium]
MDHNTSGALHGGTNYGKIQNYLKIKDFTLEDFALIQDIALLETLLQELAHAHGIPSTSQEIDELTKAVHGKTQLQSSRALTKLLRKVNKDASDAEIFSKFKPIFSRICKEHGIKKIQCIDNTDRFLGNVQRRIDVSAFACNDITYIKDQQLLARILYKYFKGSSKEFSYEKALTHAQYLQKTNARQSKQYLSALFSGIDEKEFKIRFRTICDEIKIRRIKIIEHKHQLIWIKDKKGTTYRGVDGGNNAYMSIYISPSGEWKGECISAFAHNQKNNRNKEEYLPKWKKDPDNIHVIDIYKKDAIEITVPDSDGKRAVYIVQKMNAGKGLIFALHSEANASARESDLRKEKKYIQSAISSLHKYEPRFVYIDPLGRVIKKENITYER